MMNTQLLSPIAAHFEAELAGHVVAHKLSGSGLENADIRGEVLTGIRELMQHDVRSLLISGAGSSLTKALGQKLLHPETRLRITPKKDIPHIEEAIANIGTVFSQHCDKLGIPHVVLPHSVTHATRLLDGHKETGGIVSVDHTAIQQVLDDGKLAILPFGGTDSAGNTLNVNADDVAARASAAVGAKKLIMYTNAEGIMMPDTDGNLKKINFLDFHKLFHLMRMTDATGKFVIDEGMFPKVKAILEALTYGVPQVHVVQAKTQALLEELFTRTGSGTLIEKEPFLELHYPAQVEHLEDILQLREECSVAKTPCGTPLLKPLSPGVLEQLLPTTLTLQQRDMLVGTIYFQALDDHPGTALLGGFAVGENHQNSGYGKILLESALDQIGEVGFKKAVSVTASDAVKNLYKQQGGNKTATDLPTVLNAARERYGSDHNLVELFTFNTGNPHE